MFVGERMTCSTREYLEIRVRVEAHTNAEHAYPHDGKQNARRKGGVRDMREDERQIRNLPYIDGRWNTRLFRT